MVKLKALVFQTNEHNPTNRSTYNTLPQANEAGLFTIEVEEGVLTYNEWEKVPLVRNALEHFSKEKQREVLVRQKKAQKFWAGYIPFETGAVDSLTCLSANFREWKKGCLVFERIHEGTGVLVFIDYLQLDLESLEVSNLATGPIQAKHVLLAAGPTPNQVDSEVMSVLSLVGMTLIASQPEIGIPLMIGAQIFSFLFGHMGDDTNKQKLPTAAMIMKELPSVVANETIKQLTGEANSVWDDIHQKYDQSWELDMVPSKADLQDFEGILDRAVGLSKVGSVHDNVNIIYARINDGNDDKGNRAGLRWIPGFIWCATVEIYCLELKHNLYYAWSNGGVGEDAVLNDKYENALKNWHQRAIELHGYLVDLIKEGEEIVSNRLGCITAVQARDAQKQVYNSTHPQTVNGLEYYFEDHGIWPEVTMSNPIYHAAHFPSIGCCSVTEFDQNAAGNEANKARDSYVSKVRNLALSLTGSDNTEMLDKAVTKWKVSIDLAASLITDLKTMRQHHK